MAVERSAVVDRKANLEEVTAHRTTLVKLSTDLGLGRPRVRRDGTVVVHSSEAGYRSVAQLSVAASEAVGAYVHVITDDVPGAAGTQEL